VLPGAGGFLTAREMGPRVRDPHLSARESRWGCVGLVYFALLNTMGPRLDLSSDHALFDPAGHDVGPAGQAAGQKRLVTASIRATPISCDFRPGSAIGLYPRVGDLALA
jgi:hypothetical protein